MKHLITVVAILSTLSVCAQPDQNVVEFFKNNISRTSLRKMYFFEPELISICEDTTIRIKVFEKINRYHKKLEKEDLAAQKERTIFLSLLRDRIEKTPVNTPSQHKSKRLLLRQFSSGNINFDVDLQLVAERVDPKKRGLPFGDEECDEDFSLLVFFLYDPSLYVSGMTESKIANRTGKVKFPLACTLEELNSSPLFIKKRVQAELLNILSRFKGPEYDFLRKNIMEADLNATQN